MEVFDSENGVSPLRINVTIWATVHLPIPLPNINRNSHLSLDHSYQDSFFLCVNVQFFMIIQTKIIVVILFSLN